MCHPIPAMIDVIVFLFFVAAGATRDGKQVSSVAAGSPICTVAELPGLLTTRFGVYIVIKKV